MADLLFPHVLFQRSEDYWFCWKSGDAHFIRMMFGFRAALPQLPGTTARLLQASKDFLVP
jgi:hypothetical protein